MSHHTFSGCHPSDCKIIHEGRCWIVWATLHQMFSVVRAKVRWYTINHHLKHWDWQLPNEDCIYTHFENDRFKNSIVVGNVVNAGSVAIVIDEPSKFQKLGKPYQLKIAEDVQCFLMSRERLFENLLKGRFCKFWISTSINMDVCIGLTLLQVAKATELTSR